MIDADRDCLTRTAKESFEYHLNLQKGYATSKDIVVVQFYFE